MSGSSSIKNELEPDFHGYYKHHFLELFPQNGGHVSPPFESDLDPLLGYQTGEAETVITPKNCETDKSYHPPISFFARVIGEELSEYKKETLKAILHQTVVCLNQEADEIFRHILATLQISSDLQAKEQLPCNSTFFIKETSELLGSKKRKSSSSPDKCESFSNTLNFNSQVVKKLCQLEQNVEEYLDMVVSKCRPMTLAEKQQLGRKIQKLPEKALDRVVEVLQCSNSSRSSPADTISVNLEELDDVILWRLYYVVQSVAKANEL
ncbi:uncharacterized protein LOC122001426 isoform X1 [Zingiber officinale]|uniref:uncharacterized protein LOC122001426 isoform X1 n=1 Tax=Zingiber officinale TaxID=94328 RepID=UPI001C4DB1FF|nr:uncharacterized protein LOC122001426 isoform X1 [Zingiber officinale]XP_042412087.1 uncharacterized protein LOC122001426 isoform X1 [Zingiber officinale]XP_042412088.1 uncharacterized protein LOC122001426 isoform X1 [Zingiber officinale]XP_042412089.1 uncharacterized protein LOC122001426 isoform X1 [Zingiber officinale]